MEKVPIGVEIGDFVEFMRRLFDTRRVFLRELVQNSLEAIASLHGAKSNYQGSIEIHTDRSSRQIRFFDNGCGMTKHQLQSDLSKVFHSGWPRSPGPTLGIGQFGFGFFRSCLYPIVSMC